MSLPKGTFVVGNKLYGICSGCAGLVRLNGIFGGLHCCAEQSPVEQSASIDKPEPMEIYDVENWGTNKEGTMEQGCCKVRRKL